MELDVSLEGYRDLNLDSLDHQNQINLPYQLTKNIEYLTVSLTGKHGTSCSIPKSDHNEWLKSQPVVLRDGKSLEDLNIYDNAFEFHELLQCEKYRMICLI